MRLKQMMKMLAAVLVTSAAMLAPRGAWADTWTDGSGNVWTYSATDVSATVTAVTPVSGTVAVPATLGDVPVVGFGTIFANNTDLVNVTIPASVASLAGSAFLGCTHLKSVTFANGSQLATIGAFAFQSCSDLESFTMPDTVTEIGLGVFAYCSSLKSVHISNALANLAGPTYNGANNANRSQDRYLYQDYIDTAIPHNGYYEVGTFANCSSLTSVTGGETLLAIPNLTFYGCSSLVTITIPDSVTYIGRHAFYGCSSLKSVALGAGVTTIDRGAFNGCANFISATGGGALETIASFAFQGCSSFKTITLPSTLKSIGDFAFANCSTALTAFTIPTNKDDRTIELGYGILSGCSALKTVTLGDSVKAIPGPVYNGANNAERSQDRYQYQDYIDTAVPHNGYYEVGTFANCSALTTVNWGSGVETIGNLAFYGCAALKTLTIPDSVTSVGNHAFYGCASLRTVSVGNGVRTIGRGAFNDLANLVNVTGCGSVETIGAFAFADCVNLKPFALPTTLESIGDFAFARCSNSLTAFTIPTNKYQADIGLGRGVFSGCSALKTVSLGDSVKAIPGPIYNGANNAERSQDRYQYQDYIDTAVPHNGYYEVGTFANCSALTTVNWGSSVEAIGDLAFYGCASMTNVVIPDTVETIGNHAFYGCTKLGKVVIGSGVTAIGRGAFAYDANLIDVTCGANVETISSFAFYSCENLKPFALPSSLGAIGDFAFSFCHKAFTSLEIPTNRYGDDVTIGYGAFQTCTVLKSVSLGDSVKVIPGPVYNGANNANRSQNRYLYQDYTDTAVPHNGYYDVGAFCNCRSLDTINWGSSVETIGDLAFYGCSALKSVTIPETVTSLGNHAFYDCALLTTATIQGNLAFMGRAVFGASPLFYVQFTGTRAPVEQGNGPLLGTTDETTIYAAPGSKGWTGDGDVPGLPADGTWGGAKIVYGVPPTYTINFHRNDSNAAKSASKTFTYGLSDHLPSLSSLGWARRGFDFKGWATSEANANAGKVWKADWATVSTAVAAGKTLNVYAVWAVKSDSYAIKFIRNDGAGTWRTVGFKYGEKTRLPSLANGLGWARRGFDFKGWALTTADANAGKIWKADWAYVATAAEKGKTLTLYAVWALKAGYYQIRFNKNDGTTKWRSLGFQLDLSTKLSTIAGLGWTRTGYEFVGWASSQANASAGKVWKTDGAYVKNAAAEGKTLSIYAIWKPVAKATKAAAVKAATAVCFPAACAEEAFTPGYYTGMLADGTGTYALLLDAVAADGARTGYLCVTGEEEAFDAECEAVPAEGSLLLQLEDGRSVLIAPDGTAELR